MEPALNFPVIFGAALIPMILGMIWYSEMLFGKSWAELAGVTKEKMENAKMPVILGVSYILSVLLAFALITIVVHQFGLVQLMADVKEGKIFDAASAVMADRADAFRTFKHGALHGAIAGLFIILPVFVTNSLFERKPAKLMFINVAYWIIVVTLMGGVLCQWGVSFS